MCIRDSLNIVERSARLFDEVIVLVLVNPNKRPTFSAEERVRFIQKACAHIPNVKVDSYHGQMCIRDRSMASSDESPVTEYHFEGGSAAGWDLNKSEYRSCVFSACRLTGAHLEKAWLRDVVDVYKRQGHSPLHALREWLHHPPLPDRGDRQPCSW